MQKWGIPFRNFGEFYLAENNQCLLAQKHLAGEIDLALLEHAVGFCLSNKTFSMKDLADTYRFYKAWAGEDQVEDEPEDLESMQLSSQRNKHPITVAQRDLQEYSALLKSSSGEQS